MNVRIDKSAKGEMAGLEEKEMDGVKIQVRDDWEGKGRKKQGRMERERREVVHVREREYAVGKDKRTKNRENGARKGGRQENKLRM